MHTSSSPVLMTVTASRRRRKARVHTLPMTEEPPSALYPQADVFVLASAGESFGMVAAEAAAAGTPVIVSDRCGIAGFFEEGEALVVPYDREAVVEAIRSVLSDPQLRERLARGGPAAARRMSWDHVTDLQEEIYRAVASQRRRRSSRPRLVAPVAHELARTLSQPPAQLRVPGELAQGVGRRG